MTKAFVRLTGKTLFGPKWSLGYSGSTMHYTDAPDAQNQLMNFIRLCEQHAIPLRFVPALFRLYLNQRQALRL